jgi:hypothetical protein
MCELDINHSVFYMYLGLLEMITMNGKFTECDEIENKF